VGSGKLERLQSAVDALGYDFPLEDWYAILQASRGHGIA